MANRTTNPQGYFISPEAARHSIDATRANRNTRIGDMLARTNLVIYERTQHRDYTVLPAEAFAPPTYRPIETIPAIKKENDNA